MNNANSLYSNLPQFNNAFDQPIQDQGLIDPTVAFNHASPNPTGINPGSLDLSQFQNSQFPQHRAQPDGLNHNQSPAFHNPAYQVSSVVPAKRPRPGEDNLNNGNNGGANNSSNSSGIGLSPQPNPSSRSQTPQQPTQFQNPNFPSMQNANNPFSNNSMYQHLQSSSQPQATPSPTMQNQNFRPQAGGPQRMQSSSPHSMTGGNTPFGNPNQMHNNTGRMATPQNPAMMQSLNTMGMHNQGMMRSPFPGQFGGVNAQNPGQLPPNMQLSDQYRMQLQQAQQHAQQQMQNQAQANQRAAAAAAAAAGVPGSQNQTPGASAQNQARNSLQAQIQSFTKNIAAWCQSNNITLDPDPRICGKPIPWFQLFAAVSKTGVLTGPPEVKGNWARVANFLQVPEPQSQQAAMEAKELFEKNLLQYFVQYTAAAQKRIKAQRQPQPNAQGGGQPLQGSPPSQPQPFARSAGAQQSVSSPGFMPQPGQRSAGQSMSPPPSMPTAIGAHATNGAPSPLKTQQQTRPSPAQRQPVNDEARNSTVGNSHTLPQETPSSAIQTPPRTADSGQPNPTADFKGSGPKPSLDAPVDTEWKPGKHPLVTYGGIELPRASHMGIEILKLRPGAPLINELGIVDMHDLSRRLQSGFLSEITPALDQLVIVSSEIFRLHLKIADCGDLLDSLIDCGEQQLEILAPQLSGEGHRGQKIAIDKLIKNVRHYDQDVQDRSFKGDEEFELEHVAERIIAISTILRNLSFIEYNHAPLADSSVTTFLCHILRLLQLEKPLLRTSRNTLDFMKDAVTIVSNIAQKLKFPSKDHASIILDFLLAFLPSGSSVSAQKGRVKFMSYRPTQHQYLPCAVDGLAKLLAHDHPNRFFLKTLFAADIARGGDLLTRAFGLAISIVPERATHGPQLKSNVRVAGARNSFLSQAMLAADILASLIPDTGRGLAQSWLESEDGWVANLLHLVLQLAAEPPPPAPRRTSHGAAFDPDAFGFDLIIQHSLSMIQRLVDKSELQEDGFAAFSTAGWPPLQDAVVDALAEPHFDPVALKHLCGLAKCVR